MTQALYAHMNNKGKRKKKIATPDNSQRSSAASFRLSPARSKLQDFSPWRVERGGGPNNAYTCN
jgi:hypothetical protein